MTDTFTPDLDLAYAVADSADRLVSVQVFMSGGSAELTGANITRELYDAARAGRAEPLIYTAAKELLDRIKPRDTVVFCTGFFDPPSMIDEMDGPLGCVALARMLCVTLDITPVFLTEVANMERMAGLAASLGLEVLDYELARTTPFKAAVMPLPIDHERAKAEAERLCAECAPAAMIAVEKPAPCPRGRYHTGKGLDVTDTVGKVDHVFAEARARGILTIGIGDGGNEVGMGAILDDILRVVPTGNVIGTPVETDLLVVAAIANWGAYAIGATIAAALHMPEAIHSLEEERRLTGTAASLGFIDPATGLANGWTDGTPPVCSEAILELLRQMVLLRLGRMNPQNPLQIPKKWAERHDPNTTVALWADHLARKEAAYFAGLSD
ncbi:glutamate cyclase domain-containing protein [Salipiger abyssi]|uniref:glutamate cyclase domain-containing protein n=1 Tax=Salipiger abyssi TaxID=1250539 RepID=UPI004058A045